MNQHQALRCLSALVALLMVGCSDETPSQPADPDPGPVSYEIVEAFPALSFTRPVDLRDPRDASNRLFVVEQIGRIYVFENSPSVETSTLALDLQDQVGPWGDERGLLSLAFDPDFKNNGYLYVYFTSDQTQIPGAHILESRIVRFTLNPPTANVIDPATAVTVFNIAQPKKFHNGGQLAFDAMGYLYLGLGDSGDGRAAQDITNLYGSIIRLDVSRLPYSIPPGNMSPDSEIFAFGFRNPWRLTIDQPTGRIWSGDVGSDRFEEINVIEVGANYGWPCREGEAEFLSCDSMLVFEGPLWTYSHADFSAVIGGYVVRGAALPTLEGKYLFSDFTNRQLVALSYEGGELVHEVINRNTGLNISSFGLDGKGVLYINEWNFGPNPRPDKIYKVVEVRAGGL